ncbi:MAG: GlsB/YeaQ/YmgE family stress response membrane protein [Deltaproteobacteria bacterium]|nr:GlsB/YeaQ/YmgE family stress response membrane protein [Deltaproteobacteria bacterium]
MLGFIVLLIVAFIVGALGERIGGVKIPGGVFGSIVVGFVGAWIGGALLHFGPIVGGIQIIPAIIGAIVFVLLLRLIFMGTRRTVA